MYKTYTADDYKKYFGLVPNFKVDAFIVYGTYKTFPFGQFEDTLNRAKKSFKRSKLQHEFLANIGQFEFDDKTVWLTKAYGGAMLSEHLHLACMFGSRKNFLIGSCGGLKKGAKVGDIIVPSSSYGEESSAKAYQRDTNNLYKSDNELSTKIANRLKQKYPVSNGRTITFQAMLAETWEDVQQWSKDGYDGVEMEAATVFAVSNHFNVPSCAILQIGDNLIEEHTVMDINYEGQQEQRRKTSQYIFDIVLEEL